MPIFELTRHLSHLSDDFTKKKVHIICPAVNDLTVYNAFAHGIGGMPYEQISELANEVNEKNETGTMYPKLSLTIIPLTEYKGRNDFGNSSIMKKHIEDCFEAEMKYIKSSNMVFVLEKRGDFDNKLATDILLECWSDTKILVEYLPS